MILYFSGLTRGAAFMPLDDEITTLVTRGHVTARCFNFWEMCEESPGRKNDTLQAFELSIRRKIPVMLDSGGFSLHSYFWRHPCAEVEKKRLIRLVFTAYCNFCKKFGDKVSFYVVFDYNATFDDTREVMREMWRQGLQPMPIFHGDCSAQKALEWYLADTRVTKIGIGGITRPHGLTQKLAYLDTCFRVLWNKQKCALRVPWVHGFGITDRRLWYRFPWTSVDSSTWGVLAWNGIVLLPTADPFAEHSSRVWTTLYIGRRRAQQHILRDYNSFSSSAQKAVNKKLSKIGFDVECLRQATPQGMFECALCNAAVMQKAAMRHSNGGELNYKPILQNIF